MDIDWFTFVAQIINFLILVWLLSWLLYGPIVNAMQQREQGIARRLEDADAARGQAEREKESYVQKSSELDDRRRELLEEATQEAHAQRQQLLQQARQEVDNRAQQWGETFERDQQEKLNETRRQVAHMGTVAARQTLAQLADADLQSLMCRQFARHLQELDEKQRAEMLPVLHAGQAAIVVRSALELSEEDRQRVREAIAQAWPADAELRFEIDEELICGLELDVAQFSFSWNVQEFMKDVEREVGQKVKAG